MLQPLSLLLINSLYYDLIFAAEPRMISAPKFVQETSSQENNQTNWLLIIGGAVIAIIIIIGVAYKCNWCKKTNGNILYLINIIIFRIRISAYS